MCPLRTDWWLILEVRGRKTTPPRVRESPSPTSQQPSLHLHVSERAHLLHHVSERAHLRHLNTLHLRISARAHLLHLNSLRVAVTDPQAQESLEISSPQPSRLQQDEEMNGMDWNGQVTGNRNWVSSSASKGKKNVASWLDPDFSSLVHAHHTSIHAHKHTREHIRAGRLIEFQLQLYLPTIMKTMSLPKGMLQNNSFHLKDALVLSCDKSSAPLVPFLPFLKTQSL